MNCGAGGFDGSLIGSLQGGVAGVEPAVALLQQLLQLPDLRGREPGVAVQGHPVHATTRACAASTGQPCRRRRRSERGKAGPVAGSLAWCRVNATGGVVPPSPLPPSVPGISVGPLLGHVAPQPSQVPCVTLMVLQPASWVRGHQDQVPAETSLAAARVPLRELRGVPPPASCPPATVVRKVRGPGSGP